MMKSQKGFTVPELIVSVAITGLIVSFFGTAVYQTLTVTEYGSDKMIAMHELQNVAHWVSLDGQMAKAASGGSELVLTLPNDSIITYSVENKELHRTTVESEMTLARNISYVSFSVENRIITMDITSSPEGRPNISDQGIYKVCLRVEEE